MGGVEGGCSRLPQGHMNVEIRAIDAIIFCVTLLASNISAADGTSDGGGGAMIRVLRGPCGFLGTLPST